VALFLNQSAGLSPGAARQASMERRPGRAHHDS
jgi:hypothetical protein